ncbi:MAG TPA: hypothetical protein ENN30_01000 [Candidatus Woesearchaeota archaeon]|nr:hypothetical protein [Candidatus Woesearchaeota archaeon]
MIDEAAFLTIEFQDGAKFRWKIPRKYAWKLFFDGWNPREKKPVEEENLKKGYVEIDDKVIKMLKQL